MHLIRVRDLGIDATSLIVDGQDIQIIEIDKDTYLEGQHGNLDIINSLAGYFGQ